MAGVPLRFSLQEAMLCLHGYTSLVIQRSAHSWDLTKVRARRVAIKVCEYSFNLLFIYRELSGNRFYHVPVHTFTYLKNLEFM